MSNVNFRGRFALGSFPAILIVSVSTAWAHPEHAPGAGLLYGVLHLFLGFDHLAILLVVGAYAARHGERDWLIAPARFAMIMGLGIALGLSGLALPGAAGATALAMTGLAICSLVRQRLEEPASAVLFTVAAFAHGQMHANAWEGHGHPLAYALGIPVASGAVTMLFAFAIRRVTASIQEDPRKVKGDL